MNVSHQRPRYFSGLTGSSETPGSLIIVITYSHLTPPPDAQCPAARSAIELSALTGSYWLRPLGQKLRLSRSTDESTSGSPFDNA